MLRVLLKMLMYIKLVAGEAAKEVDLKLYIMKSSSLKSLKSS